MSPCIQICYITYIWYIGRQSHAHVFSNEYMKCKFAQHTFIQTNTHTHTVQARAQTHEHTCLDTHIHTHTHICVQTTHTHTQKRARKDTDTYINSTLTYKHTRADTRIQSHTNTNTYLHSLPLYSSGKTYSCRRSTGWSSHRHSLRLACKLRMLHHCTFLGRLS